MGNLNKTQIEEMVRKDLEKVLKNPLPFQSLDGKTILITGASGLIGENIIKLLLEYGEEQSFNIKIIGLCRNKEKAEKTLGAFIDRDNIRMLYQDISEPIKIEERVDYVIHGASVTASKSFVAYPVETIETALKGTQNVLEFAREKKIKGMVYLSSLEVYGVLQNQADTVSEEDYGRIDPLNVRSSYSEGKRMAECLCVSYGKEYGIPVKIARLGQTFGCGVDYDDARVFAEFARCAIEGRDIILHTEGKTIRNYCYTMDAAAAVLYILLHGKDQNAYNVANRETEVSIYEMGKRIIELSGAEIGIRIELGDIASYGYNPTARTVLDTEKLEGLGWKPQFSFEEMIQNLIRYMRVEYNGKSGSFNEHL